MQALVPYKLEEGYSFLVGGAHPALEIVVFSQLDLEMQLVAGVGQYSCQLELVLAVLVEIYQSSPVQPLP